MKFTIPIEPVGQMRARSTAVGGHARTYKAAKQRSAENKILAFAVQHRPATPMDGPLEITVDAYLPIKSSFSRLKKSRPCPVRSARRRNQTRTTWARISWIV